MVEYTRRLATIGSSMNLWKYNLACAWKPQRHAAIPQFTYLQHILLAATDHRRLCKQLVPAPRW